RYRCQRQAGILVAVHSVLRIAGVIFWSGQKPAILEEGRERSVTPVARSAQFAYRQQSTTACTSRSHKQQGVVVLQAFLISIFCCFFATSAGFGNLIRNTPLSNFASTFAGSGSNGKGIARLNEPEGLRNDRCCLLLLEVEATVPWRIT